jgi:hypothetical protein
MIKKLQELITAISARGDQIAQAKDVRKLGLAGRLMKNAESALGTMSGIGRMAEFHEQETGSWVTHEQFVNGIRGPFDACDLRHWLTLAEMAGVSTVPAKEILHLSEDEMSFASGKVDTSEVLGVQKGKKALVELAVEMKVAEQLSEEHLLAAKAATLLIDKDVDPEKLQERLFTAMDDVPEGWMVRSARCGPSNLKALAGAGVIKDVAPEVRFGPDLEVGPGWVRHGNRRSVHVRDHRTVQSSAEGPVGGTAFLARPWMEAARYMVSDDPHRHGTPFAGKGVWPAEWRAFVEDGQVVGVSFYYSWTGEVTPENARVALEVADLAQKVIDVATREKMHPRFLDVEFMRIGKIANDPEVKAGLDHFGRDKVACTLDFIETKQGIMLLEGGPGHTIAGGGHPCGFAGCGGRPKFPKRVETVGVAFKNMDHVLIGDPKTWEDGNRDGCILSFDEVRELARSPGMSL